MSMFWESPFLGLKHESVPPWMAMLQTHLLVGRPGTRLTVVA